MAAHARVLQQAAAEQHLSAKPRFFDSAAEFRQWLAANHDTAGELLVGFYKTSPRTKGMTYREALDEALAFGWIDGVRTRVDDGRYSIRFTPRKPRSIWSLVNIKRVRELIELGRMQPSGLAAFDKRDEKTARSYSYEREHAALDPALAKRLEANAKARAFFDAQPPGYRKIVAHWIMSAKKEETRERRLALLIERSSKGARIDLLKPRR